MKNIREELRSHLDALRAAGVALTMDASPALTEINGRIAQKRSELKAIFDEAGDKLDFSQVKSLGALDSVQKVEHVRGINAELDELAVKRAGIRHQLADAEDALDAQTKGDRSSERAGRKSVGDLVAESAAIKQFGMKSELDVDLKTLMTRSAGWAPESLRDPGYVPYAAAPLQVTDLFQVIGTTQAAVKYMEQTIRTNNAAERAEGDTYGEAAFVLADRTVIVESLGVWIPVTDEQLEDEPEVAALINDELPMMLRQRLDSQLLVGDGNAPNIFGVNNVPGILTQAKGADPVFDAIYKGIVKVQTTGFTEPSNVVLHPLDWQDVRLTRTADGIYILGSPTDPGPRQLWGLPVATSTNQTQNTGLVGDFANWARLRLRRGIVVERTNSHDTHFINGKQAIRAGFRCAAVYKRPSGFCTITGI